MALDEIYLGDVVATDIVKAYLGDTLVFERGGGLDPDVQAILDQAVIDGYTPASGTVLTALNTFVLALKADGIWTLLDALWLPATNGDSDFATYNLKDPTAFQLTKVNSPIFTSLEGFTGDGVSAYLDTNFSLNNDGVNFLRNTASFGAYQRTQTNGNYVIMGISFPSSALSPYTFNVDFNSLNSGFINNGPAIRLNGFNWLNRTASNAYDYFNNSTIQRSYTNASAVPSSSTMKILSNGGNSQFSPDQVSFSFIGGDLSIKSSEFYNAIQAYMTTLGTEV